MNNEINFAQNLTFYRTKRNLKQHELADMIGFSVKSISKWESGRGMPTITTMVDICRVLRISIDELLFKKTDEMYFVAISGGGTRGVIVLKNELNLEVKRIEIGGIDPNDFGIDYTCQKLNDGIKEICKGIPYKNISLYAGISGGDMSGHHRKINDLLLKFGFAYFRNGSDMEIPEAFTDDEEKIHISVGTGFVTRAISYSEITTIGGWGKLFDEGGCAYTFGRDAVYAALKTYDGTGEETIITDILNSLIKADIRDELSSFYSRGKDFIASLWDSVFIAAEKNDKVAWDIIDKNCRFIAHNINVAEKHLKNRDNIKVYFSGELLAFVDILFPTIRKYVNNKKIVFISLAGEQMDGGIKIAMREYYESLKD